MKLEYKVLWIEDDESWLRVPKIRLEKQISDFGFIPKVNTITDCDLEKMEYSDYDLILIDYKLECENTKFGNEILSQLRNKKILADAIFYSSVGSEQLYDEVKKSKIPNVTIFERDVFSPDNIKQIFDIIEYYLKKDLDLNSMRGIMMAEVASFDNKIWDLLNEIVESESIVPYVKCKTNTQKKDFDRISNEKLLDQLTARETSTIFLTSGMRGTLLKNLIKAQIKNNPLFADNFIILKDYYDEIITARNKLAHRENIQSDDEEKFIQIRQDIIKHKTNLCKITEMLSLQ